MPHASGEEPAGELLHAAAEAGFEVSRAQLHRWQQAGLLPTPRQRGRGRGRGSTVLYPAGSTKQLVALCRQLRKNKKPSFTEATWGLWWQGFPVPERELRGLFEHQLRFAESNVEALEHNDASEEETPYSLALDRARRRRSKNPLVAAFRRRVKANQLPTVLHFFRESAAGRTPELGDDAPSIAKAFDLSAADVLKPILPALAALLNPQTLREGFEAASTQTLAEARDELRSILKLFAGASSVFAAVGFGSDWWRALLGVYEEPSSRLGTYSVLWWLVLRQIPEVRQRVERIVSIARTILEGLLAPADVRAALDAGAGVRTGGGHA